MWLAGQTKKKGGRGMSTATVSLWDTAPATAAVRERPVHELLHQRAKLDEWSEQIRVIRDLLPDPDVSPTERLALSMELAVAKCGALACANAITACEERMRQQHARMQRTHGHLL